MEGGEEMSSSEDTGGKFCWLGRMEGGVLPDLFTDRDLELVGEGGGETSKVSKFLLSAIR